MIVRLAAAVATLLLATTGIAQEAYPSKPIRLVVPYPAGGPLDQAARALAERVKDSLGTVVVENRAGAGGNIGVDYVAKQPADGYTLVIGAVATHAINPWLFSKLPYDPVKDFTPLVLIAEVPNVLVMTPETAQRLNVKSVADLIAYAKANPARLNYASGGNGSGGHMAGELMKSMAGVFAVHIPYAGASPAQLGLLSGQTDFMFDNLASAAPLIRSGKLTALAVTTRSRAPGFADVPTMSEAGGKALAGFDVSTWFGVFAPAGLPASTTQRLIDSMGRALQSAEMRERLARMAAEPAALSGPRFGDFVQRELAKYRPVVRFSGARVD